MPNNSNIKFTILDSPAENHASIAIEPVERGYGDTLGNPLRRVMLGYLHGAAVTRVKINDAHHEFSSLKGIHEDVVELIQNLKEIDFNMEQIKTHIVTLDVSGNTSGERVVVAGDLKCPAGIEVINKDHHLAALSNRKSSLAIELVVEYGRGYRLPEGREKRPVGTILVDANFSPVILVNHRVEKTRVGRETDLDRLVMDIQTNGSISPQEAIQKAAAILAGKFEFIAGDEIQTVLPGEESESEIDSPAHKVEPKVYLEELNLPTRVLNTLKNANFETIQDLDAVSEEEVRKIKNIGPKTVDLLLSKVKEYAE